MQRFREFVSRGVDSLIRGCLLAMFWAIDVVGGKEKSAPVDGSSM